MTDRSIHRLSKEYVKIRVTEPTAVYDPAVIQVKVGGAAWRTADVLSERDQAGTSRVAVLCEPAADGLQVGNHTVLVRVGDSSEVVVFEAGLLTVTG